MKIIEKIPPVKTPTW